MNDQDFDLRRVAGVLRRQWRLIGVTFLVLLGLTSLGILALRPIYTASTLVLVDPNAKNLLNPSASSSSSSADSARVDSEVQIVMADTTLRQVVTHAELTAEPSFGPSQGWRERVMILLRLAQPKEFTADEIFSSALSKLRQSVRASRSGMTYLMTISASAESPEVAARVANTLANDYIAAQLQFKVDSILSSRAIIDDRITEAFKSVSASEQALNDFVANSIDDIVAETGRDDLGQMQAELKQLAQTRLRLGTELEAGQRSLTLQDWQGLAETLKSDTLRSLEQRQADVKQQLNAAAEGSEAATNLQAELSAVLSDLGTGANAELSKIRDEVSTVQARTSDMQLRLRTALLSSDLPPAILTNVYELQQTAELARSQYQTLLTRQKELEAQAYLQIADSRVVSPATVPSNASFPDTKLFLAIAGLAALAVGIALAFVLENYVGGFSSEMQLASVLRLPSAIAVPKQRVPPKTATEQYHSVADTIVALPFSIYAESIRHLQVSIDQALRETGANNSTSHIIMVTSATASEGKTTLALSLTRAYALSGRSAILIDCDLRKPSVHVQTGMQPSPLLLEYLADSEGARNLTDIEVNDTRSKAKLILGARSKDVQGSQVITGESFSELIKEVRATNSVVVLDTPPAGLIVDALFLAGLADVVVDVTRYGRTSQRDARMTFDALKRARRPNIPIIAALMAVERSKRANRRKYGGYYIEQET